MEKKDIVSYNYDELQDEIKSIGEKPFRAKQIYAWLHEKLAEEVIGRNHPQKLVVKQGAADHDVEDVIVHGKGFHLMDGLQTDDKQVAFGQMGLFPVADGGPFAPEHKSHFKISVPVDRGCSVFLPLERVEQHADF